MRKVATIRNEHQELVSCKNCKHYLFNAVDKVILCLVERLYNPHDNCPNDDYSSWEYAYNGDVVAFEYISEEVSE